MLSLCIRLLFSIQILKNISETKIPNLFEKLGDYILIQKYSILLVNVISKNQ